MVTTEQLIFCSTPCEISASYDNVMCENNGTNDTGDDDIYYVDLLVSDVNAGQYEIPSLSLTGMYNQVINIGPFNISDGNQTIEIIDSDQNLCMIQIELIPPVPCSNCVQTVDAGTGGTISGTGKYLKEQNPDIKIIGVDAFGSVLKKYHETKEFDEKEIYPYRIEGLGKNLIPGATDFDIIDEFVKVTDEDSAHTARLIAKTEGMFVGYTSGAVTQALIQLGEEGRFKKGDYVVVIYPDHGARYMSKVYSDKWMNEQGFFDSVNEAAAQNIQYIK